MESFDRCKDSHPPLPNISLTSQDVTRWKMFWRAIQGNDLVLNEFEMYILIDKIFVQRCKNWPDMDDILEETPIAFGFGAAALIYGGLHALAWFAHFDLTTAQMLWRISACVVMGGIPVLFVLSKFMDKYLDRFNHNKALDIGGSLVTGLILVAYILARGYLVVECFINLSHLPAEVYDVPTWSTYFPHIS